jgi:hypothetical protein
VALVISSNSSAEAEGVSFTVKITRG